MDGALNMAADRQFLCDDVALHLCAFGDHDGRGVQFALDVTKNRQAPVADNLAEYRKVGTDRGDFGRRRGCNGRPWHLMHRWRISIIYLIALGSSEHVTLLLVCPLMAEY